MSSSLFIFASGISTLLVIPAYGNSRSEAGNAIVMIAVRGKAADQTNIDRIGTGFIVGNSRYVLTAGHVVAPPPGGWGKKEFDFPDVTIAMRSRDLQTGLMTELRMARVHRVSATQDAALLEFDGLPRNGLSTCPANDAAVTGTQLIVAGVPASEGATIPKLELNVGILDEQQAQDQGLRRISAQTRPGFSGGPVFITEQQDAWQPVGLLKGGQSFGVSSQSLFTPLKELRGSVIAYCPMPCRDESHGVERYDRDELGPVHVSDWLRGGSTSEAWCGSYRSAEMNAHPGVSITIEQHRDVDQRFFTGWRGNDYIVREAQYKFSCQLRYRSGPTYKLDLSAKCPAAPNPDNLPN